MFNIFSNGFERIEGADSLQPNTTLLGSVRKTATGFFSKTVETEKKIERTEEIALTKKTKDACTRYGTFQL